MYQGGNSAINDSAVISGAQANLSLLKEMWVCEGEKKNVQVTGKKINLRPRDNYESSVRAG